MKQNASTLRQRRQQAQRPATSAPATAKHAPPTAWTSAPLTARMLAPLRLFLGVTFVYAGIQKLTDPQFFSPDATGYIGRQITAFAAGSPIRALLLNLALPHAALFGSLIAWGELAIGIGALLGLLLRPAAFFGALLSMLFFLSASWRVHPYFYGSDIVFLFAWLTILLAGPAAGGWFALDTYLAAWLASHIPPESSVRFERAANVALGVQPPAVDSSATRGKAAGRVGRSGRYGNTTRRDFVKGAFAGVTATLGAILAVTLFSKGGSASATSGYPPTPTATTGVGDVATATVGGGSPIAMVSQVPKNSAVSFTLPANGDPGVLVHLSNGNFVAFDAVCTHAGCPVQYDPSSRLLLCPCHGAAFDPAQNAAVVQGPADIPLASAPVHVDNATGAITVSS
ncbi:MAG TPA: TQO small subunit DoxD [Ktedonobacterales bacterium]|nr:TQO small subunit DoxD [Ktedonobacterales bacterium]